MSFVNALVVCLITCVVMALVALCFPVLRRYIIGTYQISKARGHAKAWIVGFALSMILTILVLGVLVWMFGIWILVLNVVLQLIMNICTQFVK